jgi:hypothetical protein
MLMLVLCAVAAQAPSQPPSMRVALVKSSNLGVEKQRAADLLQTVEELAALETLEPIGSFEPCDDRGCLLAVARKLDAVAVISVGLAAAGGGDTVMDLECLRTADGESLAQLTFTVRAATPSGLIIEHVPFLQKVKKALLQGPPPPRLADQPEREKPVVLTLTPAPTTPPTPEPEPAGVSARARTASFGTGAIALATAVAGGTLLAVNYFEADSLRRQIRLGIIPAQRVPQAVAIDERTSVATGLLICAGVTLLLTVIFVAIGAS